MVTLDLNKIKNYLSSQPVTEAWLFGSFARGEQRSDSDIDIIVSFDKSAYCAMPTFYWVFKSFLTVMLILCLSAHYIRKCAGKSTNIRY